MDNFCVIYGEDKALVNHEFEKIISSFKDYDIISYDMMDTDLNDVIDDASTVSMFSNKKVIVLRDCYFLTANKSIPSIERLEEYFDHYNSSTYLFFLVYHEKLDVRKKINKLLSKYKVVEVKKKEIGNLESYVIEYIKKDGYKIGDVKYFLSCVGSNILNIENELDKLMMYKIDDKNITNEDIDKVCVYTSEDEIFSLTDAVIYKDHLKAFRLLEEFLNKNYDEMQIIMLLASQFRFFFQVKRLLNKNKSEGDIAKILEVNPYRVKFTTKKLYSYSEEDIKHYIHKVALMDHDIKLGIMDKRLALELFITMS